MITKDSFEIIDKRSNCFRGESCIEFQFIAVNVGFQKRLNRIFAHHNLEIVSLRSEKWHVIEVSFNCIDLTLSVIRWVESTIEKDGNEFIVNFDSFFYEVVIQSQRSLVHSSCVGQLYYLAVDYIREGRSHFSVECFHNILANERSYDACQAVD